MSSAAGAGRIGPSALALAACALVAFAANSLLCRAALGARSIDAASFTLVRVASGAAMLGLLARASRRGGGGTGSGGSWVSAGALFVYAIAFSFAYLRLATGVGALVLFGVVQLTMAGAGVVRGERPRAWAWVGLATALAGLAGLTLRGTGAPDLLGASLMAVAGAAWGVYSLRGRASSDPLAATAGNFARAVPFAVGALVASLALGGGFQANLRGIALAAASGALASGLGYTLWYAALRSLTATLAGTIQLAVPVLAALAGVALLGESLTLRLAIAGTVIVAGLAIAIRAR